MKIQKKQILKLGGIFLGIYLISTAVSFGVFSFIGISGSNMTGDELMSRRELIESEPKTEECALNGKYYSVTERNIWEARRPMGVMIENHLDSRPQSGLSRADVIYEAVAEGGITRFLAMLYCGVAADDIRIGPIRSSRVYFIDWISEYSKEPIYVHFGGANNICSNDEDPACTEDGRKQPGVVDKRVMAIEKLIKLGWRHSKGNALDGGANAGAPAIVRDQYRLNDEPAAWEHSAVGSADLLFDLANERGFDGKGWKKDFVPWKFTDGAVAQNPDASEIEFVFWENKGDYDVKWVHNPETNEYVRLNGGTPHIDWENKEQLVASNIAFMFIDEEASVDEEFHIYYETLKGGEALVFQNGTVIEGTWEKDARASRTIFRDTSGKEIEFVRGVIWIEAVPTGNEIFFE